MHDATPPNHQQHLQINQFLLVGLWKKGTLILLFTPPAVHRLQTADKIQAVAVAVACFHKNHSADFTLPLSG